MTRPRRGERRHPIESAIVTQIERGADGALRVALVRWTSGEEWRVDLRLFRRRKAGHLGATPIGFGVALSDLAQLERAVAVARQEATGRMRAT